MADPLDEETLQLYFDGELGADEAEAVAVRLAQSDSERERVERLFRLGQLLELTASDRSAELVARLRADAAGEGSEPTPTERASKPAVFHLPGAAKWGVGVVALLAAAAALLLVLWPGADPKQIVLAKEGASMEVLADPIVQRKKQEYAESALR